MNSSQTMMHPLWQVVSSAANLLPKLVVKEHSICPIFNIIISPICTSLSQGSACHRPPIIPSCLDGNGCSQASRSLPPPTRTSCNFHTSVLAAALHSSQDLGPGALLFSRQPSQETGAPASGTWP